VNTISVDNAQAFSVTSPEGRTEPFIVAVYGKDEGENVPAFPIPQHVIQTLELVMHATDYSAFISFQVTEPCIQFMKARMQFIMDSLFGQDAQFLLVRCDSQESAAAFLQAVRSAYQINAVRAPRSRRAQKNPIRAVTSLNAGVQL
jgi:hypothetical protein